MSLLNLLGNQRQAFKEKIQRIYFFSGVPTFQLEQVYENVKKNIIHMEEAKSENGMWENVMEQSKMVFQLVSALWGEDTSASEVFTGFDIKVNIDEKFKGIGNIFKENLSQIV